jgi:hypothetical protein
MPVDEDAIERKRAECLRRAADAAMVVKRAGKEMLGVRKSSFEAVVYTLERERAAEKANGARAFSKAKELAAARNKFKAADEFNPDSSQQRCALLYEWYGLPPVKNKGAVGYTSDDTAIEDLMNRLKRGTIKPKRVTIEEVLPVLQAMIDVKKWGTLERTFLHPVLR